jgi:hypothetical protein
MDSGLNGLNAISDRAFARALPALLGQLSRRPISSFVILCMRVTGKDSLAIERFTGQTRPEETSLLPMGVPVFVSIVFLFSLFVVFALLV